LRAIDIDRAALVGASVGSMIALQFALDHPAMVSALVLEGPVVTGLMPSSHYITRGTRGMPGRDASVAQKIDYWASDPWMTAPASAAARETMRRLMAANPQNFSNGGELARFPPAPALPRLAEIKVPTLIVTGESDLPDVHSYAGAIQAAVAGSRRVVLTGSGHLAHLEVPRAFNDEVLRFLRTVK
jgi:pimeloyl-ACP methyl ester carboxylesterase